MGRGRGCEAGGGGVRECLPSRDWSPAPPRGAPCARVGAARRKRKRARHAYSRGHQGATRAPLRSPGSPARALSRSSGSPACAPSLVTWNSSVYTHRSSDSPVCAPLGDLGLQRYPTQRRSPAHPSHSRSLRPLEEERAAWGWSPGRPRNCPPPFTSSRPWAGAEAAAAERTLPVPPHAARAAPGQ